MKNMNRFPFEIRVRVQSVNRGALLLSKNKLKAVADDFGLSYMSINLPIEKKKITVLKSPHVNKKARDQYEILLLKSLIILKGFKANYDICKRLSELQVEGVLSKFRFTLANENV